MPITDCSDPASSAPWLAGQWAPAARAHGRYARARAADLFGDPGPLRAARDGIAHTSRCAGSRFPTTHPTVGRRRADGRRRAVAPGRTRPPRAVATRRRPPSRGRFLGRRRQRAGVRPPAVARRRPGRGRQPGDGLHLSRLRPQAGLPLLAHPHAHSRRPRARSPAPFAWWPYALPPDDSA